MMRRSGVPSTMLLVCALATGASSVAAQELRIHSIEEDIKSLPTEGEYAGIHDTLATCVTCHGLNGPSVRPDAPLLSGQHQYYIYVQLKDFKAGRRASDIMRPLAEGLEKDQMMLIGKFFSEQHWPRLGYRGDPEKVKQGQRAAESGECTACHLGDYRGNSRVPHIAGQQKAYLLKTMMDFKNDVRRNAAAMQDLFASYSDEDIEAMAEFLADY